MRRRIKHWNGAVVGILIITAITGYAVNQTFVDSDQIASSTVFKSGEAGYPHFRIPGIVTTNEGTLLAFAEGRFRQHDHAQNDMVLKRSTDNGLTWGDLIRVHSDSNLVMVNPSPLVLKTGRVLIFYETFPKGYHAREGEDFEYLDDGYEGNVQQFLMKYSDNDGLTWSRPRDLTMFSRPAQYYITSGSPASSIQLAREPFRDRIIVPLVSAKKLDDGNRTWQNSVLLSDDGGETWTRGDYVPNGECKSSNEFNVAELDNGDVMINARPQIRYRRTVSVSQNGGLSWTPFVFDEALVGRPCHSGLFRYSYSDESKSRLIFTHNFDTVGVGRRNGTIRISYDEGKTWAISKQIVKDDFGYSNITKLKNGDIGVIYEPFGKVDQEWSILFMRFPLEWLEN